MIKEWRKFDNQNFSLYGKYKHKTALQQDIKRLKMRNKKCKVRTVAIKEKPYNWALYARGSSRRD